MSNNPEYISDDSEIYSEHGFQKNRTGALIEDWMDSKIGNLSGKRIVDAGCGSGRWFDRLSGARQLIGVDQSEDMLDKVQPKQPIIYPKSLDGNSLQKEGLLLVCGNMKQVLSRFRQEIDLVFANFSLCVCDEPQEQLEAIHIALKTGGRALISTNIFIHPMHAPDPEVLQELSMEADPVIAKYFGGVRRDLRLVLHLENGDLPITDKLHVPGDYIREGLRITEARCSQGQELTFVDGEDIALNLRYYGDTGGPHIASTRDIETVHVQCCFEMVAE